MLATFVAANAPEFAVLPVAFFSFIAVKNALLTIVVENIGLPPAQRVGPVNLFEPDNNLQR